MSLKPTAAVDEAFAALTTAPDLNIFAPWTVYASVDLRLGKGAVA